MELTREIVLAEPPGKRLDSWIAEKVMEWKTNWLKTDWYEEINPNTHRHKGSATNFKPSTDIAAAWEVVEMFSYIDIHRYDDFFACAIYPIGNSAVIRARGKTMPEAICKAALLAVMEG